MALVSRLFLARVLRVIDGDTVELMVDLGFRCRFQDSFRLAGIDAPERNFEATEGLRNLLTSFGDSWISVRVTKPDKYGRWLVTIPLYEQAEELATVNQKMIELGYARPYDGGVK